MKLQEELAPLGKTEYLRMLDVARDRDGAMERGRAVFDCTVGDSDSDCDLGRLPRTCARVEYQWESETVWHAQAWDGEGILISDTAADGTWVEADGKRWHINYLVGPDGYERVDDAIWDRRDESEVALDKALWCQSACDNHLYLHNFLCRFDPQPDLFFRDESTGEIHHVSGDVDGRVERDIGIREYLGYLRARILAPRLPFDDFLRRRATVPCVSTRMVWDGEFLHPLRSKMRQENAKTGSFSDFVETWRDPVDTAGGYCVGRVFERSVGGGELSLSYRMELDVTTMGFGPDVALSIRPVDYDLPSVDW